MSGVFVFRQVSPPGASLTLRLDPTQITQGGGVGGWVEVPHPKRPASTEYDGQPLRTLEVPLMFDGWRTGADVEEPLRILDVWGRIPPGRREPAVLQVEYGTLTSLRWVVQDLAWGPELRNSKGRRVRAEVTVSLLEHRDAVIALTPVQAVKAPATSAATPGRPSSGAAVAPSGKTYTVRSGDTLSRIAQSQLGAAAKWPALARLNGLRDPDRLTVGQRLRLPS
ncbi:MAG: LysM domain-containing protein [Mycobacteriales bacterium]